MRKQMWAGRTNGAQQLETMSGAGDLCSERVAVHSVPCRIRIEDGVRNAAVNSYFASSIRNHGNDLSASLRGRPLRGLELQVPSGYTGVVLGVTEHADDSVHQECRELSVHARISSLHYWSLGTTPSTEHRLPQALAWTHIADTLHAPLPVDES